MILVDTSVWIDHFNGVETAEVDRLAEALRTPDCVLIGDLILLEILQGVSSVAQARITERALIRLQPVEWLNLTIARQAAAHYRLLRSLGITPRKTADLIIGTWCIAHDCELLHRDRDFIPMQRHLELRGWAAPTP